MKDIFLLLVIKLSLVIGLFSQNEIAQPQIIILPYTPSGENALILFESDFSYRTVVIEIANALTERGFKPDDLQEIIQRIKESEAISTLKGVSFDPVERILQYSSADIAIKAEVYVHTDSNGANSVQINLRAVDKVSSKIMYAMNFDATPHFKTDDYGYLGRRALVENDQINKFVEGLNASFLDVRQNGRSISCYIETNANSQFSLGDEITDNYDLLADVLIKFVKENAYKGNFRVRNNSENQLYFDDIRIPLQDENGINVLPDDFARDLRKYIAQICSDFGGERVNMPRPIVNNGIIRIILP